MKEGDVVVMADGVAGTVITLTSSDVHVLTKNGFVKVVPRNQVTPHQEGADTVEDTVNDRFENKARSSKRKAPSSRE